MKFPLVQLYSMNRTKPIVELSGIPDPVQWDYCDLEGLPPERIGTHGGNPTMNDMGKLPKGQWDNLPKTFTATNGAQYFIEYINLLRSSK